MDRDGLCINFINTLKCSRAPIEVRFVPPPHHYVCHYVHFLFSRFLLFHYSFSLWLYIVRYRSRLFYTCHTLQTSFDLLS